jgi:GNAT superfamily N-acetyltransferase
VKSAAAQPQAVGCLDPQTEPFMELKHCAKTDYDQIVAEIVDFWGSDRTLALHHPMFVYEFGNSAYVIKDGDCVAAYLFGFLSQTGPIAYVHLVGVRTAYRRQGLARRLYDHFVSFAQSQGCTELKAITTPGNKESFEFHRGWGMELTGKPNREGIPVMENYAGPGQDRVVFRRKLNQGGF